MTCYTPMKAYYDDFGRVKLGLSQESPIYLPCGRCNGCRTDKIKDWAVRCHHESQLHTHNCVLTLTFDEQHINEAKTLVKEDIQNFIRDLRHFINRNTHLKKNYPDYAKKKLAISIAENMAPRTADLITI